MLKSFRLMGGLGDCLIAGAALQKLDRPVDFITNKVLEPVFKNHPTIKFFSSGSAQFDFKWVSQIKDKNLYGLHTMQRFSAQLGFYIDPTEVLNIYDDNKSLIINSRGHDIVINQFSAEGNRRCIPSKYIDMIYEIVDGDNAIRFIGQNGPNVDSVTDISQIIEILRNCKLFIGPISFCYHLAACLRTNSVLFTSYMPPHKFSHFRHTTSISANASCSYQCEEHRSQCLPDCLAYNYDDEEVYRILNKKIKGV